MFRKSFAAIILGAIALIFMTAPVQSQTAPAAGPVVMTADKLVYDNNTQISVLTGNVKFTYEDMVMTSESATFNGKTKTGYFNKKVKIWKPGSTLTGDEMTIFYQEKRGVINGNVRGVSSDLLQDESDTSQSPVIVTGGEAEYFWGRELVFVRQNVIIRKSDRIAYSDRAVYEQSSELATLTGNVRFEQGRQWMIANEAVFDLKAETFLAKGGVKAEVYSQQETQREPLSDDRILTTPIEPQTDTVMADGQDESLLLYSGKEDPDFVKTLFKNRTLNFHRRM